MNGNGLWVLTQSGDLILCDNFRVEKSSDGWIYIETRPTTFFKISLGRYSDINRASYVMKNIMTRLNNNNSKIFVMSDDAGMGVRNHVD